MKKISTLVVLGVVSALFAQSAWATISLVASPSSQSVQAGTDFNVTLSLNVTQNTSPSNFNGYDVILEALASQNAINLAGLFSVTGISSNISGWQPVGSSFSSDPLDATGSDRAGYVQNHIDLGFGNPSADPMTAITTPISGLSLLTITLHVDSSVAPGVYNFSTTNAAPNGGSTSKRSRISDFSGATFNVDNPATFSITVTGVPEPATWSLLGLGGLGSLGLTWMRARRRG